MKLLQKIHIYYFSNLHEKSLWDEENILIKTSLTI